MSGIYIPGMEMPKEGEYHMTLYVCGDGAAYVDVAELPADEDRFAAIPVPQHGRLIEADIPEDYRQVYGFYQDYDLQQLLDSRPTVIPGDKEAKDD